MNNLFKDTIFSSFVYSCEFDICPASVSETCLRLPEEYEGVVVSNRRGWQSPGFRGQTPYNVLNELALKVLDFSREVSRIEQLNIEINIDNFWVNINPANAYNMAHTHPGSDLVVVYYAKVPENSGDLFLVRNDSALSNSLFINSSTNKLQFGVSPQVGRAYAFPAWLLHYVEASESEDSRVSISFNMKCGAFIV
jgi:uncharacterized protein (TIGR02466 family)